MTETNRHDIVFSEFFCSLAPSLAPSLALHQTTSVYGFRVFTGLYNYDIQRRLITWNRSSIKHHSATFLSVRRISSLLLVQCVHAMLCMRLQGCTRMHKDAQGCRFSRPTHSTMMKRSEGDRKDKDSRPPWGSNPRPQD